MLKQLRPLLVLTFGKKGRNTAIEYEVGKPRITKDGVTIIKNVNTRANATNIGLKLLKQVASNTNVVCGDGTTSSTLIAHKIYEEGLKYVESGGNPVLVKRGIEKAKNTVLEFLEAIAVKIDHTQDLDKLFQVAMVASNYDKDLSEIVSKAISKSGPFGKINVEKSNIPMTELVMIEGGSIMRGYASHGFKKNAVDELISYENPRILTLDFRVSGTAFLRKIIDAAESLKAPLIVMCREMEESILNQLVFQFKKKNMQVR